MVGNPLGGEEGMGFGGGEAGEARAGAGTVAAGGRGPGVDGAKAPLSPLCVMTIQMHTDGHIPLFGATSFV